MLINFGMLLGYAKVGAEVAAKVITKLPWKQIIKYGVSFGAGAAAGSAATGAAKDKAHEEDLAEKNIVIQTQEARISVLEDEVDQMISEECDRNDRPLETEDAAEPPKETLNSESEDASDDVTFETEECA